MSSRSRSKPGARFRLEAMALDIPEFPGHPNRVPFSGILTRVDQPSDRAPAGAAGRRVLLPRATAERALPSLLGMAVDYAPGLRGHDVRRKIGIITRAEIQDDRLQVAGYLFAKDFPDLVNEVRARRERLGMSYEVTEVRVTDPAADIWRLEHVVFTGAAILERSAAAYQQTSLAAAQGGQLALFAKPTEGVPMNEPLNQTLELLAQSSQALAAEVASLRALVTELRQAHEGTRHIAAESPAGDGISTRLAELARSTDDLRRRYDALESHAERFSAQAARKTVPPQVFTLLAKNGVSTDTIGSNGRIEVAVLDKAIEGLPVEQRIAVKSQLSRAGVLP